MAFQAALQYRPGNPIVINDRLDNEEDIKEATAVGRLVLIAKTWDNNELHPVPGYEEYFPPLVARDAPPDYEQ